jgi:hypothetical protein
LFELDNILSLRHGWAILCHACNTHDAQLIESLWAQNHSWFQPKGSTATPTLVPHPPRNCTTNFPRPQASYCWPFSSNRPQQVSTPVISLLRPKRGLLGPDGLQPVVAMPSVHTAPPDNARNYRPVLSHR